MNTLYYGDNLDILRRYIKDESVDLIYLDPPFNSNATYNVLFTDRGGRQASAQLQAFKDTWSWPEAAPTYQELILLQGRLGDALRALGQLLPEGGLLAYLVMMAPRLAELHRVLKPTGSIYLHCDPTASHYLKVVMDAVFGAGNFRSEVIWKRTNIHNDSKNWSAVADTLLYYAKDTRVKYTWNPIYLAHSPEHIASKYRRDTDGRLYTLSDMTSPHPRPNMMYEWKSYPSPAMGWRYSRETMERLDRESRIWYPGDTSKRPRLKRFLDEMPGTLTTNIWTDIPPINSQARERLGYPTQKPEALLERIIQASSNPDDLVLDPFCGCGTTITVAQATGRRWIGIDITYAAIRTIKMRLADAFPEGLNYEVVGEPTTVADAARLAEEDPYQFQWWITGLVGARPAEQKKGADKGVDGRLYFSEGDSAQPQQIILSVKAGHVTSAHVDQLHGVVEKEGAAMGALLTLNPPTGPMVAAAAAAGIYVSPWGHHPRLQILTAEQLLAGKGIDMPPLGQVNVTFKKAPRARRKRGKQSEMGL